MSKREFPEWPLVGVGGVVIDQDRALLVRRATEPALGEWTIPGGLLEVGETLTAAVEREILEETGLTVRVVELIEALERIFSDSGEIRPDLSIERLPSEAAVLRNRKVPHRAEDEPVLRVEQREAASRVVVQRVEFVFERRALVDSLAEGVGELEHQIGRRSVRNANLQGVVGRIAGGVQHI